MCTKEAWTRRKHGISVLLPTQNEEQIVELSIRSLVDFADEIVVVDNGSTDNTIAIVERLAREFPHIRFFNRPEIKTLFENREFALQQSRYSWVCRFDSDYVFYKDMAKKLRQKILNTKQTWWPKAFEFYDTLCVTGDFFHYRGRSPILKNRKSPSLRIYQYFPGFGCIRSGSNETVTFPFLFHKIPLRGIYFCQCTIKSAMNLFFRSERHHWRGLGMYETFPTLADYMKHKYQTDNFESLAQEHYEQHIRPELKIYDEDQFVPLPEIIHQHLKKHSHLRERSVHKNTKR